MSPPRITKTQRWLDLIAYLSSRRFPVAADELMELPAYCGMRPETARRVFERDKTELRAAGVPIETVRCSAAGNEPGDGYLLAPGDFYLPYLLIARGRTPTERPAKSVPGTVELSPEDAADAMEALSRASRLPGSPLAADARRAHAKLALDLDPETFPGAPVLYADPPGTAAAAPALRILADAVMDRRVAVFRYHGIRRGEATDREVEPYGLVRTGGNWYLVARDPTRAAVREFRVARMEGVEVKDTPGAFEVPAAFRLEDHLGREAWELGDDTPLNARVAFSFPLSLWAERSSRGQVPNRREDGSLTLDFAVRQAGPFLRWILSLGPNARIEAPPELASQALALARRTLAGYADPDWRNA